MSHSADHLEPVGVFIRHLWCRSHRTWVSPVDNTP